MLCLHLATYNPFSENTYIIYNDAGLCWIIDPGMYDADEQKAFEDFIAKQELKPQGILNTHAHLDHIFGVEATMKAYSIPFALHPLEGPVLARTQGSAAMFGVSFGAIPQPTQVLKEGMRLMLGDDEIEVLLVPGHSPGSVVFYCKDGGWAIAGDTLFYGSIGRTDLPGGDHATLLRAIREQLFTLPDETLIYPGHGPITTIGEERESNLFLKENG